MAPDVVYFVTVCALGFALTCLVVVFLVQRDTMMRILHPKKHTQLILMSLINNFHIKIQTMQLEKQKWVDSILGLVDTATQEPIEATFSNIVL